MDREEACDRVGLVVLSDVDTVPKSVSLREIVRSREKISWEKVTVEVTVESRVMLPDTKPFDNVREEFVLSVSVIEFFPDSDCVALIVIDSVPVVVDEVDKDFSRENVTEVEEVRECIAVRVSVVLNFVSEKENVVVLDPDISCVALMEIVLERE